PVSPCIPCRKPLEFANLRALVKRSNCKTSALTPARCDLNRKEIPMVSHALGFPLSQRSTSPRGTYNASEHAVVSSSTGFLRPIAVALLVAISYYAGSRIGFLLTPVHHPLATFWPRDAILLAALFLTPARQW